MNDYYNLLGVAMDASPETIRKAFRHAAKEAHPDAHPNLPPRDREVLNHRFIRLAQAYEILSDPPRRAEYDQGLTRKAKAQDRARRAGFQARPGPKKSPKTDPKRDARTGSRPGAARPHRPTPPPDSDPEDTLDDLLQDVENLLGRFGLDMRLPIDQLLNSLLDWAKELFQDVVDAFDPPDEEASSTPDTKRPGEGPSTRKKPAQHAKATPKPPPKRPPKPPDLDAELADLKRKAQSNPGKIRAKVRANTESDLEQELAELKRTKGRTSRK